jgi:hypothetical protein
VGTLADPLEIVKEVIPERYTKGKERSHGIFWWRP